MFCFDLVILSFLDKADDWLDVHRTLKLELHSIVRSCCYFSHINNVSFQAGIIQRLRGNSNRRWHGNWSGHNLRATYVGYGNKHFFYLKIYCEELWSFSVIYYLSNMTILDQHSYICCWLIKKWSLAGWYAKTNSILFAIKFCGWWKRKFFSINAQKLELLREFINIKEQFENYLLLCCISGCKVVIASRNLEKLDNCVQEFKEVGEISSMVCNIRKEDEVRWVDNSQLSRYSLHNFQCLSFNAGIWCPTR